MADDLEHTVADLGAERDRVTGLLEARRQLVAGVSHELRTPIATVRGYLESVLRRDGALPADLRGDLQVADSEVTRLEGLIDDLFTLSRAEAGRLDLRLEPTDVGALVRTLMETQAPLAWRQRQVQLVVDVPSKGPIGLVDPRRVTQIVSNLLSNAVRHTPPGGLVAATVTAPDHTVRIEVRDTGEGIPAQVMPLIFKRFYQGSTAGGPDDDETRGAGLGLALVKELAESMGGGVEASSQVGEGSCFAVWLPGAPAS
jgi:signal transduction histidine kinase